MIEEEMCDMINKLREVRDVLRVDALKLEDAAHALEEGMYRRYRDKTKEEE